MTPHEQSALHIWSVLVLAARNQQILRYYRMERITGLHRNLQAPILGRIENYCKRKDLPHLTSILVNEEDGVPGYLYPGFRGADAKVKPEIYLELFREQSRVFIFDWLKNDAPSVDDFT
jgi:hypothetical protein